jgi:hypothetical protein
LAFPAPPPSFRRRRRGPWGLPRNRSSRFAACALPPDLGLPFKELARCRTLPGPASHGIRLECVPPPTSRPSFPPSPQNRVRRPAPGAPLPHGSRGPSSRFLSASTVHRRSLAGLLHPAADQGFAAFPAACDPKPEGHGPRGAFPATRFTPFEGSPSPTAVPRHRGRCLPEVPPSTPSMVRLRDARGAVGFGLPCSPHLAAGHGRHACRA